MTRPSLVLTLLGSLASACDRAPPETASTQAASPTWSRLYAPDPWSAGETVIETGTYRKTEYGGVPDGSPRPAPRVVGVDYEIERRCVEADTLGHWASGVVTIRRWVLTGGAGEDRSLEGAGVYLDAEGKWRFTETREVSPSAKTWIEQNLAGRAVNAGDGDGVTPEDWPAHAIEVGKPVVVRIREVERGFVQTGVPFPDGGIMGAVVLESVEPAASGPRIAYSRSAETSLEGALKRGDRVFKYLPGSVARHSGQYTKVLGACHAAASKKLETVIVTIVDGGKGPIRSETLESSSMQRTR